MAKAKKNSKPIPQEVYTNLLENLSESNKTPKLFDIVEQFIKSRGGVQAVGAFMAQMITDPNVRNQSKVRIMDVMFRCLGQIEARSPSPDDFGLLSDADLDREIKEVLKFVRPVD